MYCENCGETLLDDDYPDALCGECKYAVCDAPKYCFECGSNDLEDITSREFMGECHGFPAYKTFVDGYICNVCGHEVKW